MLPPDTDAPSDPSPISLNAFKRPSTGKLRTPSRTPRSSSYRPASSPTHRRAPTAPPSRITKISPALSHTLRSAQTILDPAAIIKELLENALDVHATRIDIRLRGKASLDSISVSDNGRGIHPADYSSLCLPSSTSKLASFQDLDSLHTFGFRGEALSAICAIASSTTFITRTLTDSVATSLSYSNTGTLTDQRLAARPVGTTVQVENIFHALPVRRKDALKNAAREITRCVAVVQALALISINTRIELKIGSDVKVSNLPSLSQSQFSPSSNTPLCLKALRTNAKSVLGARTANSLIEISSEKAAVVTVPLAAQEELRNTENEASIREACYACHGLVSRASLDANGSGGRARSSLQYIYVNRRPVDFPRLSRAVNELYRRATGMNGAAPVLIMNLVLPAWSCDVNLAPDKRLFCLHEEDKLISGILKILEEAWMPTNTAPIPIQSNLDVFPGAVRKIPVLSCGKSAKAVSKSKTKKVVEQLRESKFVKSARVERALTQEMAEVRSGQADRISADIEGICNDHIVEYDLSVARNHQPPDKEDICLANPGKCLENNEATQKENNELVDCPSNSQQLAKNESPVNESKDPQSPLENQGSPPLPQNPNGISLEERTLGPSVQFRNPREILRTAPTKGSTSRNVTNFITKRSNRILPVKRQRMEPVVSPSRVPPTGVVNEEDTFSNHGDEPGTMPSTTEKERFETVYDAPHTNSDQKQAPESIPVLRVNWENVCASYMQLSVNKQVESLQAAEGDKTGKGSSFNSFKKASVTDPEADATLGYQQEAADKEMSRLFQQEWFNDLEILGQFNRGFIIARLGEDLFIIDQHASDEKYNFENLQKNTVISKQRLVKPLGLEFSAQDELIVMQHMDAFRAGGFDIECREQNRPTQRLYLKAQPISKHTIFVQEDLQDIVNMLKNSIIRNSSLKIGILRPPRVRAMFASRACRMSIMIGTALQNAQMEKIVRKLANIEHPWTCPHGRPTMRHLCSLPL